MLVRLLCVFSEPASSSELQHLCCDVYGQLLTTVPAMARTWWKDQDRKTSAFIDK